MQTTLRVWDGIRGAWTYCDEKKEWALLVQLLENDELVNLRLFLDTVLGHFLGNAQIRPVWSLEFLPKGGGIYSLCLCIVERETTGRLGLGLGLGLRLGP